MEVTHLWPPGLSGSYHPRSGFATDLALQTERVTLARVHLKTQQHLQGAALFGDGGESKIGIDLQVE